jgi:hypothetical protein
LSRRLLLLLGGCSVLWLLLSYPAFLLGGQEGVMFSAVAAVLCMVPTAATLVWCDLVLGGSPEQQLMAVFGGTGIRIIFVLGSAMILYQALEMFHATAFWLWIVVFYLATLTWEMTLVVRRQTAMDKAAQAKNSPSA